MKVKLVYEQVREKIEDDARQLSPGEALPSEMRYTRNLEVSRYTVRKAVDELVSRGVIRRIHGRGLVAAEGRPTRPMKILISLPFVVEDSDFYKTLMGCIDAANRLMLEYKIIGFTDVDERLRLIQQEDLTAYSGAVVSYFESEADQRVLALMQAANVALMTMGNARKGIARVRDDSFRGGYMIGEYLAKKGHRDIVYLTTDRPVVDVELRLKGFIQALKDFGCPVRPEYLITVKDPGTPLLTLHAEQRALPPEADRFLRRELPFTALTGYSMLPILSMCKRMHKEGFRVPDDVSVVGYGEEPAMYFAEQNLPLTAVVVSNFEMGASCVQSLYDYMTGKTKCVESHTLPGTLQRRNSVRAIG